MKLIALAVLCVAFSAPAAAQGWVDQLQSGGGGLCCSNNDGERLLVEDWRRVTTDTGDAYEVLFAEGWLRVPPQAVVHERNRDGIARVWSVMSDGTRYIRCFLAGTES